jgi:hypothetical protein
MPKPPKRPRDPAQLAKLMIDIAAERSRIADREAVRAHKAGSKGGHAHSVALFAMYYNFVRIHKTLRTAPAMAARVTDRLWEIGDIVNVLEAWEAAQ